MRVLVFTNMFPTADAPFYGAFVEDELGALRRAGVEADMYFVNGRANKLNYAGMPLGFFRRIRRAHYDVIHVHHSFCGLTATMQRAIPVVWTFHEGEISGGTADALREQPIKHVAYSRRLKRFVAKRVDAVVVVAEHLREPLGRPDAAWISAGLDLELFAPMDSVAARREAGLPEGKRYVLFPASPSRVEKRYELARAAVEIVKRSPGMDDVELIALDNIPHKRVPLHVNASELMLMTSAFEASPVTIREALACNVPVVSTDVGDARVVLGRVPGCVVAAADPARIAEAVRTVLAAGRRVQGRETVREHSLENVAGKLIALYERVIASRGGNS